MYENQWVVGEETRDSHQQGNNSTLFELEELVPGFIHYFSPS